jgi:hypothetical protein
MTPAQIASLIRSYTRTNSSSFTDAEILELANPFKDEIASEISQANEDYFVRTFLANLRAGQREYSIPNNVMNNLKYVEAKLDGTKQQRLDEFDLNTYRQATDETTILAQFAGRKPAMDLSGGSIFIYSDSAIIDVTDGLIAAAVIFPDDIADLTSTTEMSIDPTAYSCGFPRQFHELLARRVSIAWKSARPKPIPLSEKEQMYEIDLTRKIEALKGLNLDRTLVATMPSDDGQDY